MFLTTAIYIMIYFNNTWWAYKYMTNIIFETMKTYHETSTLTKACNLSYNYGSIFITLPKPPKTQIRIWMQNNQSSDCVVQPSYFRNCKFLSVWNNKRLWHTNLSGRLDNLQFDIINSLSDVSDDTTSGTVLRGYFWYCVERIPSYV